MLMKAQQCNRYYVNIFGTIKVTQNLHSLIAWPSNCLASSSEFICYTTEEESTDSDLAEAPLGEGQSAVCLHRGDPDHESKDHEGRAPNLHSVSKPQSSLASLEGQVKSWQSLLPGIELVVMTRGQLKQVIFNICHFLFPPGINQMCPFFSWGVRF